MRVSADLWICATGDASRSFARCFLVLTVLCCCVISGCSERRSGDLDVIREHGEIRVAVRPGFFDSPAPPNEAGDQETQLRHLAARLGAEIQWVDPQRHDQLIEVLESGRADLVAARISAASLLGTQSVPTAPVEWVEDFLVAGADMPELSLEDLRGGQVHVQLSGLSPAVGSALEELGLEVVAAPENLSAEELLAEVVSGEIPLTVTDSGILERAPDASAVQLFGPITRFFVESGRTRYITSAFATSIRTSFPRR